MQEIKRTIYMKKERHIIALDLGTGKIAVAVARIEGRDTQIIYYRETPSEGIGRSYVQNERNASKRITEAITEAEESLGIKKIESVVVSLPKYFIRQENVNVSILTEGDGEIDENTLDELRDMAGKSAHTEDDEDVIVVTPQSYSDGDEFQIPESEIIGRCCDRIEGHYKVLIGKKMSINRLGGALKRAGLKVTANNFQSLAAAKAVLSDTDIENGVALVDLGAGATTVSIFKNGVLRHYGAIPFGGKTITGDIRQECGISDNLAENIKKGYGICCPDRLHSLSDTILQIRSEGGYDDTQVEVKTLSTIITARMAEIINAVLYEIQKSGMAASLRSGIVLTGGGANLTNCCQLFEDMSGLSVRRGYPDRARRYCSTSEARGTSAATCLGMILDTLEKDVYNEVVEDMPAVAAETVKTDEEHEAPKLPSEKNREKKRVRSFVRDLFSLISETAEESEEDRQAAEERRREEERKREEMALIKKQKADENRKRKAAEKERREKEKVENGGGLWESLFNEEC